jgi:ferric-chelate reductase
MSMIQESIFTPLHISVFYTRAPVGVFPFKPDFFRSTKLTLSAGRPKISKIVEDAISRAAALRRTPSSRSRSRSHRDREQSLGRNGSKRRYDDEEGAKDRGRLKGVVVGVCGPVGMADGVFEEVGKVDRVRRDQVGGVEVHEE